ncbi:MAG: IS66 family transposase [Candidatus Eisenbacteria bacterium]|nr:IS66 family transposase [Candidatus Eisenbacteria bacterium]
MKTAEAPAALIERCKYEPSVYAHIAVAKYSDHLPLHRQSEIFKRYGIDLPKSTMWDMLGRVDELVSQPVLERMRAELLLEKIIQADETPVTVRLEGGKGTQQSYVWVYRAGAKIAFDFRMGRDRDGPNKYLALWQGILQGDGYSGYDEITRRNCLTRAGCWAHARRKVKVALDLKSPEAARLMVPIQRLFRLESTLKRRAEARGYSREEYLLKGQRAVLPKGPLGKAIGYIENQREPLGVFVNEPRLEIDNNQAENALRPIAVGRKNWLVFSSPRGGAVACRLYSLVLPAERRGSTPSSTSKPCSAPSRRRRQRRSPRSRHGLGRKRTRSTGCPRIESPRLASGSPGQDGITGRVPRMARFASPSATGPETSWRSWRGGLCGGSSRKVRFGLAGSTDVNQGDRGRNRLSILMRVSRSAVGGPVGVFVIFRGTQSI